MSLKISLNEKIALLAKAKKVSQSKIAAECNTHSSHINRFFKNKSSVQSDLLIKILKILNIDLELMINVELLNEQDLVMKKEDSPEKSLDFLLKSLNKGERRVVLNNLIRYSLAVSDQDLRSHCQVIRKGYKI